MEMEPSDFWEFYDKYQKELESLLEAEPESEKEWINTLIYCAFDVYKEREVLPPMSLNILKGRNPDTVRFGNLYSISIPSKLFEKWFPNFPTDKWQPGIQKWIQKHPFSQEMKTYMSRLGCSIEYLDDQSGVKVTLVPPVPYTTYDDVGFSRYVENNVVFGRFIKRRHTLLRRFSTTRWNDRIGRMEAYKPKTWLDSAIGILTAPHSVWPYTAKSVNLLNAILVFAVTQLAALGQAEEFITARFNGETKVQRFVWAVHTPVALPLNLNSEEWSESFQTAIEITMQLRSRLFKLFGLKLHEKKKIIPDYVRRISMSQISVEPVDITTFCVEVVWPPYLGVMDRIPLYGAIGIFSEQEPLFPTEPNPDPAPAKSDRGSARATNACFVCGHSAEYTCSQCLQINYCSQQCQQQHWYEGHQNKCQ